MGGSGPEEFTAVFRREYLPVVHAAWLVVGDRDRATEIAQEAFTRMYVHWRKVSGYDRPGAWARRVAIRLAVRDRDRASRVTGSLVDRPAPAPHVADPDLHAAILTLPRNQRAAVVLHYLEDLPVAEVAAVLGCRESTARVHLHRARLRLGELLGEDVGEVSDAAR